MGRKKKPRRKVTRHFRYAWIEFATSYKSGRTHADDGVAFQQGMRKAGGASVFRLLRHPRKAGRWVDDAHETLPIRAIGTTLMALPNEAEERKLGGKPIKDPIFVAYRKKHGEAVFDRAIRAQNDFLADWLLAPGVKRHSKTKTVLTTAAGADAYADFVGVSGHGVPTGEIWWGGHHLFLGSACRGFGSTVTLPFPKYVIIGTCNCGAKAAAKDYWQHAMRRPTPVRGFFGYANKYKGGGRMQKKFAANLKKGQTVLAAWKNAHPGTHKKSWSALVHEDAKGDTLKDLIKGKLKTLKPKGDIYYFDNDNFGSGGEKIVVTPPDHPAYFFVKGGKKVGPHNVTDSKIGLFPGEKGWLELGNTKSKYKVGDKVRITFFLYRDTKAGVELTDLLKFSAVAEAKHSVVNDGTFSEPRVLEIEFTKETKKLKLPFTVNPDATKHYKADGGTGGATTHGLFWVGIEVGDPLLGFMGFRNDMQAYGVWLRSKP